MNTDTSDNQSIAIIGIGIRVPLARTAPALWDNLIAGATAIRRFSVEELTAAGVPRARFEHPSHVPYGTELAGIADFDADFFGFSPREAKVTDPQQRIFLQTAWEAMEDAGVVPARTPRIGVFAATTMSTYLLRNLQRNSEFRPEDLDYQTLIGNDKDFIATRVAFKLGLTGPALTVQSACSSSLVAIHQAVRSLRAGESDVALAGGVSIVTPQTAGYRYEEGGIHSRDGQCRPFDKDASGTVRGNGCGIIVLKRLSDAVADGDRIHAVLAGSAINNDGSDKMGFTAPGIAGQAAVIGAALADAGVPASDIGYVETHGTGTALGDPLEFRALSRAHTAAGGPAPDCLLGSIKANLGHLDVAAGVLGVIKTALILSNQTVPPQLGFDAANPHVPLGRSAYDINTEPVARELRAAAVSSFGLGGTNAHCVLTRAPQLAERPVPEDRAYRITVTARDRNALTRLCGELAADLRGRSIRIDDLAHTLAEGRTVFAEKLEFAAHSSAEAAEILDRHRGDSAPANANLTDLPAARGRKISLPGYPFDTTPHWVDPDPATSDSVASTTTAAPGEAVDPDRLAAFVLETARQLLGDPALQPDSDFYASGGQSMTLVRLVSTVRDTYELPLGLEGFERLRTIEQLVQHIRLVFENPGQAAPAVVTITPGDGSALFLVPPAGGTNFCYQALATHLPGTHPIIAFTAAPATDELTVRELAARNISEMRRVQPDGPYRVGGYSFGGNVAFEMAIQLEAAGQEVADVVIFDSNPPEAYVGGGFDDSEFFKALVQMVTTAFPGIEVSDDQIPTSMAELPALMRQYPEVAAFTEHDAIRFAHLWRQNHDSIKRHYPDRKYGGTLTILRATTAFVADQETLRIRQVGKDVWRGHATGAVRMVDVPGNHYTIFTDATLIPQVAAALQPLLG
ncbi:beta-ketoacyl synthase N-terminal-like domain-containing protein [Nocardia sp. NPDC058058]|uniref:beta-ketoacyl synthase N-terminal-like domain-containing protein n=1 Tax=Nocardia sp. NPDC058058 TaxID=3346317 RepID=UPI0036DC61A4